MKNFVIGLSKISASAKTSQALMRQLAMFGQEAELFEGTYGDVAVGMMLSEGRILHPWGFKGPNSVVTDQDEKLTRPGVKGCFYSHYRLWQKCVELEQPIIIWEDDIILVRGFKPVEWEDVLVVALGHPGKSAKYWQYFTKPSGEPAAVEYFQSSMPGCCGYAIKPHAAQKLLDVYSKTYLPADNAINIHHVKIQIHNYIMGRALVKSDGKVSLTSGDTWDSQ